MTGIACHRTGNTEDCLARFTRRASSNPPLLALLPLEGDVLPKASTTGWSCDRRVTQKQRHCPSTRRVLFDALAPHGPSGQARLLLPSGRHTPCSSAYPERELHEMCLVLTDDTRLARPERLEEVEGVCRRWTCHGSVTQEQTRTK